MASTTKIFSLEGKSLKLTTAEDLEPHIAELRANDIEEIRLLGNTLGVGACKLLGEILATKKNLKVSSELTISPSNCGCFARDVDLCSGRQLCRYLHGSPP